MIRICTIIDPCSEAVSAAKLDSGKPVILNEEIKKRLAFRAANADDISLRSALPTFVAQDQRISRVRILIGPASMAQELDDINRFLIAKAEGSGDVATVSPATLEKLATDLRLFAVWLAEYWNRNDPIRNYLNLQSPHRLERPTYAYRAFLMAMNGLASSTKNNRISAVRMLYEHLEERGILDDTSVENYQKNRSTHVYALSSKGLAIKKRMLVSDLRIRHSICTSTRSLKSVVVDDGIVRPLSESELIVVLGVLQNLDNAVLRLCAYLALNCGARLQTVLTLRRFHAQLMRTHVSQSVSHVAIPVGGSHLAQTKRRKEYVLQIPARAGAMTIPCCDLVGKPRSVAELVGEYENSRSAKSRYQLAKALREENSATLRDDANEYLFLGRNGMPFYLHQDDPLTSLRKSPRFGGSFKRSMSATLGPRVRNAASEAGCDELAASGLGFHDFRGTFAERNLLNTIARCENRGIDRAESEQIALRQTQRLLGHSSVESTYRYLRFRDERSALLTANEHYARSLVGANR